MYSLLTRILGPITPVWVHRRAREGKEDPERVEERHGNPSLPRHPGPLVWMHAASVGECMMLLPVIDRMMAHDPNLQILVTSGTVTSATMLVDRLPSQAFHQYVPLDYPKAVSKFLDHWKPDLAIWAEGEIWPNLIRLTKKRDIPMALINARMSQSSIQRWEKKGKKAAEALFGAFDLILAANTETARGLSGLSGRLVETSGNLKDAANPLPADAEVLKKLRTQVGRRPVWCAASTHPGEDEIMIDAHQQLLKKRRSALMILALRHPKRKDDVKKMLKEAGLSYVSRSTGRAVTSETQVLLYDTIGEMGLAYRLSKITFVCGSLIKGLAGHNPLEPARLSNAVLTGTHISSFADTYMPMFTFGAAKRVLTPKDIGPLLIELFSDTEMLRDLRDNAKTYASSRDAVLDYVWKELEPLVPERTT